MIEVLEDEAESTNTLSSFQHLPERLPFHMRGEDGKIGSDV